MKKVDPKLVEVKTARVIVAQLDEIIFELQANTEKAALSLPTVLNRTFYFESGKASAWADSITRLEQLRKDLLEKFGEFKVKAAK